MGRRPTTSHASIEEAAFRLFKQRGFEATTVQAIADQCGIGRRTLFRYFESKSDIPWGQFDNSLVHLRDVLEAMSHDLPIHQAVHSAVLDFNQLAEAAIPQHRQRMALILSTPALQAHFALRYANWREVIAEYVAKRLGVSPDAMLPRMVGQVSLALALSAYEHWLGHEDASLQELLDEAMSDLRSYLSPPPVQ